MEIIKTGIKGFDSLLGGGLPKGSCILLISPPVIETELFCLDFINEGLPNKEGGIVITTDHSPEDLMDKASQYSLNLAQYESKSLMTWVDSYSINANKDVESTAVTKRVGGPIALSDIAIAISELQSALFKNVKDYRFFFSSLSTLLMYSTPDTIYYFLQSILPKLKTTGGTGFLLLARGMHDEKVVMTLRHMVDGAIEIDDDLNLKILNLPIVTKKKQGKIEFGPKGFSVK